MRHEVIWTRRTFLRSAVAAATIAPFGAAALAAGADDVRFKVAMQGYSLQRLHLRALLEAARELGVGSLELYDRQLSVFMSDHDRARAKQALVDFDISPIATYTDSFSSDERRNRAILDLAADMKLRHLSCRPDDASMEILDGLLSEYEVGVAVHNTSPLPGRSPVTIQDVATILERHERLDACVDVGNFARARIDPVVPIREFRGRIRSVHLKDIDGTGRGVALGDGVLDLPAIINELRRGGFDGMLTVEHPSRSFDIQGHMRELKKGFKRLQEWLA